MPPTPDTPDARPNAFVPLVEGCESGLLLDELSDRTRELIDALYQHTQLRGGTAKGTLTLSFEIRCDHQGLLDVRANVATKEPKAERERSIFYRLPDNSLSANNPKQLTMDLPPRAVDAPAAAPRLVG
jgi:hypothetical protein